MAIGIISSGIRAPVQLGTNTWWDTNNPAGNNVIPADGTQLSSITDLGLNGNTVTQATGANQIVFKRNVINNQNAFRFSLNQYASCANSANNNYVGPLTIISIAMASNTASVRRVVSKDSGGGTNGYGLGLGTNAAARFTTYNLKDYETTNQQWFMNQYQVQTARYNSNLSVDFYTNGTFIQNVTGSAAYTQATLPLVLGAKNSGLSEPWSGDIIAVFIFYRALTTAELNLMHSYVCGRVGISSSFVPSNNPKTLLWVDGNDPNATGVTPTNGSAVSAWKDKSINGFDFSQSTGISQPVNVNNFRNGLNAVSFSSKYMDTSALVNLTSSFSLVLVIQFSSISSGYVLDPTTSATPELFIKCISGALSIGVFMSGVSNGLISTTVAAGNFYVFTYTYDSAGNAQLWQNGVLLGTVSTNGVSAAGNIAKRIGSNFTLTTPTGATICDHTLVAGTLTTAERNQMETYFRTKWNI